MDQEQQNNGQNQENGDSIPVRSSADNTNSEEATSTPSPSVQAMNSNEQNQNASAPIYTAPSSTPPDTLPAQQAKPAGGKKLTKVIALVLTVLTLIGAGAALWLFVLDDSDASKSSSSESAQKVIVKNIIPLIREATPEPVVDEDFFPPKISSSGMVQSIRKQIFEPLVTFEDKTQISPLLATSWTNPDNSTWVFKLKPGVKFNTGTPLTAQLVKASIEETTKANTDNLYTSTIKSITADNDLTLTIVTTTADPTLLNKLTFVQIYDTSVSPVTDKSGTGPYTAESPIVAGTKTVSIVANDSYHGGTVYTKKVQFDEVNEGDAIAQLVIDDKVDIGFVNTEVSADKIRQALPNVKILQEEAIGSTGLYLNPTPAGPLQKLAVRKALYKALDVKTVVEKGGVKASVGTQFATKVVPGFNPSITPPAQDVAGATKDITDAGYPDGFDLTISLGSSTAAMGEEIKAQLAKIGVRVTLDVVTSAATFFGKTQAGEFPSWISSYTSDINDSSDVISAVYQGTQYKNFYSNKALDDLMKETATTFDPSDRLAKLQDATKLIMDDTVFIPLRSRLYQYAITKPYVITTDYASIGQVGANFWKVYQP